MLHANEIALQRLGSEMKKWMVIIVTVIALLTGAVTVSALEDSSQTIGTYPHAGKACDVRLAQIVGESGSVKGTILQLNSDYLTLSVNENRDVVWIRTSKIAYVAAVGMGPAAPER